MEKNKSIEVASGAILNRTLCLVLLKEPFHAWVQSLPQYQNQDLSDELANYQGVLLLPEETLNDEDTINEVLTRLWRKIAVITFNAWTTEIEQVPANFSSDQFQEWFDLEFIDSPIVEAEGGLLAFDF